jgi:hypothetical protein
MYELFLQKLKSLKAIYKENIFLLLKQLSNITLRQYAIYNTG